jgi:hypothetical protein
VIPGVRSGTGRDTKEDSHGRERKEQEGELVVDKDDDASVDSGREESDDGSHDEDAKAGVWVCRVRTFSCRCSSSCCSILPSARDLFREVVLVLVVGVLVRGGSTNEGACSEYSRMTDAYPRRASGINGDDRGRGVCFLCLGDDIGGV